MSVMTASQKQTGTLSTLMPLHGSKYSMMWLHASRCSETPACGAALPCGRSQAMPAVCGKARLQNEGKRKQHLRCGDVVYCGTVVSCLQTLAHR